MPVDMDGVGAKLITALQAECTAGNGRDYALRRLAALLDEVSEVPHACQIIARATNRTLEALDRRRRLQAIE